MVAVFTVLDWKYMEKFMRSKNQLWNVYIFRIHELEEPTISYKYIAWDKILQYKPRKRGIRGEI